MPSLKIKVGQQSQYTDSALSAAEIDKKWML